MEQRKLKIYAKFTKSGNRNRRNPEIRLTGKWVEDWGFNFGDKIIVRNTKNGILIVSELNQHLPIINL